MENEEGKEHEMCVPKVEGRGNSQQRQRQFAVAWSKAEAMRREKPHTNAKGSLTLFPVSYYIF